MAVQVTECNVVHEWWFILQRTCHKWDENTWYHTIASLFLMWDTCSIPWCHTRIWFSNNPTTWTFMLKIGQWNHCPAIPEEPPFAFVRRLDFFQAMSTNIDCHAKHKKSVACGTNWPNRSTMVCSSSSSSSSSSAAAASSSSSSSWSSMNFERKSLNQCKFWVQLFFVFRTTSLFCRQRLLKKDDSKTVNGSTALLVLQLKSCTRSGSTNCRRGDEWTVWDEFWLWMGIYNTYIP